MKNVTLFPGFRMVTGDGRLISTRPVKVDDLVQRFSKGGVDAPEKGAGAGAKRADEVPKPKPYADPKKRPKYGKGQVEEVWEDAKDANGKIYVPNTGDELFWDKSKSRVGQWDMGHIPEAKYSKHHRKYMNDEIDYKTFIEEYTNPKNYRPESPSANRSHKYE